MARTLLTVALLLFAGLAAAQARPTDDARELEYNANHVARRLLASDDALEVAWGAHVAARHGLTDRIPDLRRKLAEMARARAAGASRILFDALIRLRAAVPGDELMVWFDRLPDEVLVLLARAPHANRKTLLEVLERQQHTVHWLAAGGLLARVKSAAFADYLVRRLHVTLDITVSEKETALRGVGGIIGAGGAGGPRANYRKDLPPVPHYRLVTSAERGTTVLCAGPPAIFYKRFTSRARPSRRTSSRDTRYHACKFLSRMADLDDSEFEFIDSPGHLVIWKGPEDLTARVAKLRNAARASWEKMIAKLAAAKLLDPDRVAGLKPRIDVRLHDMREKKSEPLPEVSSPGAGQRS